MLRRILYSINIDIFVQILKRKKMEDTKHIKISEFNYPLPDERIAKFPLTERDESKLLVVFFAMDNTSFRFS